MRPGKRATLYAEDLRKTQPIPPLDLVPLLAACKEAPLLELDDLTLDALWDDENEVTKVSR